MDSLSCCVYCSVALWTVFEPHWWSVSVVCERLKVSSCGLQWLTEVVVTVPSAICTRSGSLPSISTQGETGSSLMKYLITEDFCNLCLKHTHTHTHAHTHTHTHARTCTHARARTHAHTHRHTHTHTHTHRDTHTHTHTHARTHTLRNLHSLSFFVSCTLYQVSADTNAQIISMLFIYISMPIFSVR